MMKTLWHEEDNTLLFLSYMGFAYLFSIAIRLIWVYQFYGNPAFMWQEQLMINTNDGYIWAASALHELQGGFENNPRIVSMYQYGIVFFTVIASKILPFSLESIILYMPTVVSSLVVVPIMFLGRLFRLPSWGFFSALIGSIAWSYYNRTMTGYYDTDMFSAMAPMVIVFFLIQTTCSQKLHHAFFAALSIAIYPFLYDAGLSLVYAIGLLYMVYMVVFFRKEKYTYQSIILIAVSLFGIPLYAKLLMLVLIVVAFQKEKGTHKQLIVASVICVVLFLVTGNVVTLIWAKFVGYIVRGVESEGLKFFHVTQTVREAGRIPFEVMAQRISGSTIGVLISVLGYIFLVLKHRAFILTLPLMGIGIFSLWGGLRFTVYAVPVAAMSAVYLFYVVTYFFQHRILKYTFIAVATVLMLYPNVIHVLGYRVPTVLNQQEVQVLEVLRQKASSKDYTIAWWDYGYPIWFYSKTNTLIDGGKHNHDNFIVSKILTSTSQKQAANLARLAVETYVTNDYNVVADTLFRNKKQNQLDPNVLLAQLETNDFPLPNKSREIYLYLPFRMLNIFPTVNVFSNLDLVTGEKKARPFFFKSMRVQKKGTLIDLGGGVALDQKNGRLIVNNQSIPVRKFIHIYDDQTGKSIRREQALVGDANLFVVYMQKYNTFLILDQTMYDSLYVQLFVLENYDPTLFELVIKNPYTKIYKLRQ